MAFCTLNACPAFASRVYGSGARTTTLRRNLEQTARTMSVSSANSSSGSSNRSGSPASFGLLFDIDGVIVRGRQVLPFAPTAFRRLVDAASAAAFRIPTVFVTNAGNCLRKTKAAALSRWLGVGVSEDQVVMSHSPLRLYSDYHDKHVLVVGQGPVREIAEHLGFTKVTTVAELRRAFPALDAVDHKRRCAAPCAFEQYFPRIEVVVLFGEPTRWETSLQLILDVLITNGLPASAPDAPPYPHLPVLACNMDLQWMAEAVMPRFGHGAFLVSLEHLYKKITGRDLIYTALIGKPSEITYRHSEHVLQEQAQRMGHSRPLKNIYCIGDNVCTDIFGANLYNRYLLDSRAREGDGGGGGGTESAGPTALATSRSIEHLLAASEGGDDGSEWLSGAERCYSVLVETGVYSQANHGTTNLNHSPRDFLPVEDGYQEPTHVVGNVLEAVDLIFEKEGFT